MSPARPSGNVGLTSVLSECRVADGVALTVAGGPPEAFTARTCTAYVLPFVSPVNS